MKSMVLPAASMPRGRLHAVIYCPGNQRDSFGVCPTIDDVLDAGDGDGDGDEQAVKMISDSQVYVLNAGESVVLECYFNAAKYNMFDYPLLWKKVIPTLLPALI